jgi:hypothetical protein
MKLNYGAVAILLAALSIQAAADQQVPAYWMKKYPDASPSKTQACLVVSEEAYEKAGGTQGKGDNGFAVLAKGNAWEKCMEGK